MIKLNDFTINKLEFDEVIEEIDIDFEIDGKLNLGYRYIEGPIYIWKNLAIYMGKATNMATIRGIIPKEVITSIEEKYPNYNHISCYKTQGGYEISLEKYATKYEIYNKESLVFFLLEIKNYYRKKDGLPEEDSSRFNKIIETIDYNNLKAAKNEISTYPALNDNLIPETSKDIKEAVKEFDMAMNPISNNGINPNNDTNYLDNINFSVDIRKSEDKKNDFVQSSITRIKSRDRMYFYRNPNCFSYTLKYRLDIGKRIVLSHYNQNNTNEIIEIYYYENNNLCSDSLVYNITENTIQFLNKEKEPITDEQKDFICNELKKAVEYASSIINDDTSKNNYVKQYSSDTKKI